MDFNDFEMVLIGIGEEFDNNEKAPEAYAKLKEKLEGKNFFIVSLCMDDQIYESGIDEERIVSPMGGNRKKQCPDGCEDLIFELTEEKCPVCGKELIFNNIYAENYVEAGYLPLWDKYKKWLTTTINRKLLVVELGVSLHFPQIVRWPFEQIVFFNQKSHFIRVNELIPQLSDTVSSKGESIKENSVKWIVEN